MNTIVKPLTALGFFDAMQEGWLFDKSQSFTCKNN